MTYLRLSEICRSPIPLLYLWKEIKEFLIKTELDACRKEIPHNINVDLVAIFIYHLVFEQVASSYYDT